ncbi:MAG: hypothetical protein K8H88_03855 [Sandaracinaceae bacterium]|nr:hypothetical protein [Sandaracinaceae bacterium]
MASLNRSKKDSAIRAIESRFRGLAAACSAPDPLAEISLAEIAGLLRRGDPLSGTELALLYAHTGPLAARLASEGLVAQTASREHERSTGRQRLAASLAWMSVGLVSAAQCGLVGTVPRTLASLELCGLSLGLRSAVLASSVRRAFVAASAGGVFYPESELSGGMEELLLSTLGEPFVSEGPTSGGAYAPVAASLRAGERVQAETILSLCDLHCQFMRRPGKGIEWFVVPPFDLWPVEIVSLLPWVDSTPTHPLLDGPFALWHERLTDAELERAIADPALTTACERLNLHL